MYLIINILTQKVKFGSFSDEEMAVKVVPTPLKVKKNHFGYEVQGNDWLGLRVSTQKSVQKTVH